MPRVPLSFRRSAAQAHSDDNHILLVEITHADLVEPIRLSSDPTEPLSVDPLIFGTISNGETYKFVEMAVILPDDRKDIAPRVSISFQNIDSSYVKLARSFSTPARVDLTVVFADAPDSATKRIKRLLTTKSAFTERSITFDLARMKLSDIPAGRRMTKDRNPGLHGIPSA